jgi:peptidoglycan/xylan/chitin deacetylase (PgdA/CDA1 family)
MRESKKLLEEKIGREVKSFAYPYGSFNEYLMKIASLIGYENAVTTKLSSTLNDFGNIYSMKVSLWGDPIPFLSKENFFMKELWPYVVTHFNDIQVSYMRNRGLKILRWDKLLLWLIQLLQNKDGYLFLLFHSKHLENRNEWFFFENIIEYMVSLNCKIITVSELARSVFALRRI